MLYSKKYKYHILHINCRNTLLHDAALKAPEYGEGLDPSEEDGEDLASHQGEDERLHLTCIITMDLHSVSFFQEFLQTRNPPCISGWYRTPGCKDCFTQFVSIINRITTCFTGKIFQVAASCASHIICCQTGNGSDLKSITISHPMEEISIACQHTGSHAW